MSHSSVAHPVSRVKCHTCSSVMPRPLELSDATSLWHRCCNPPRMFTSVLLRKVLLRQLASHLHSFLEHSKMHTTPSIPQDVHLGRVLPFQWDEFSPIHWTEFLLLTRLNTIHIQCLSAADGWVVGQSPKVNWLPPLSWQENVTMQSTCKSGIGLLTNIS